MLSSLGWGSYMAIETNQITITLQKKLQLQYIAITLIVETN